MGDSHGLGLRTAPGSPRPGQKPGPGEYPITCPGNRVHLVGYANSTRFPGHKFPITILLVLSKLEWSLVYCWEVSVCVLMSAECVRTLYYQSQSDLHSNYTVTHDTVRTFYPHTMRARTRTPKTLRFLFQEGGTRFVRMYVREAGCTTGIAAGR